MIFSEISRYFGIYSEQHKLIKDKEYTVYGITFSKNSNVNYLLCDETNCPYFYNANWFKITDSFMLHVEWHLNEIKESNRSAFLILGYKELMYERKYLENNINCDKSLVPQFWEWKKYVDQQYRKTNNEWEQVIVDVNDIPIKFFYNRYSGEVKKFLFDYCDCSKNPK
jgi:hypothetical protein